MELLCPWESAKYFLFSSNIPTLFYYSHIPAIVSALFIGYVVFKKSGKSSVGTSLLIMSILFSLWGIFDLLIWATNRPDMVLFYWSLQILLEPLVYLISFYLVYRFIKNKDLLFKWKLLSVFLYLPIVLFLSTKHNLIGVDISYCNATEGFIAQYFTYIVESIFILLIILVTAYEYKIISIASRKKEIVVFSLGVILFLIAFSSGNIIGSFTENWTLAQVGLMGMPIFIGFLAYLIVSFHTFNVKLLATQVLVWGLALLIGSQFFFIKVTTNFILNAITFVGVIIFGQILVKSVKKEVEQREKLEVLTNELYEANVKLQSLDKLKTEFVSLASHQLRSPLTAIKGYTSMLLEKDYGDINPEAMEIIDRVRESSNNLTLVVEDLLNVAKIEQGGMKYEMDKVDFGELARDTARDLSITAEKKGLKLINDIPENANYFVLGDKEKLRQTVINLIDNSMKYTKEGQIEVNINIKDGKILLSIKDTGVGISKLVVDTLFQKFSRGDGAKMNSSGSGLGLYLVREIIEAHHGRVWVESEGEGKGSTFFVEIEEAK